jgi:hypothetical protein
MVHGQPGQRVLPGRDGPRIAQHTPGKRAQRGYLAP